MELEVFPIEECRALNDKRNKEHEARLKKKEIHEVPRTPFVRMPAAFFKDNDMLKKNSCPITLYMFYQNTCWCGSHHPKDIYNIYKRYYDLRRLLACCWNYDAVGEYFGRSGRTIRRWTKQLEEMGFLYIDPQPGEENILVLGELDENNNKSWFIDTKYDNPGQI